MKRLTSLIAALLLLVPAATLRAQELDEDMFPVVDGATFIADDGPAPSDTAAADPLAAALAQLMNDELFDRSQVGICVYDLTAGRTVFAHGGRQLLRPASCQKLVTAITALGLLGSDYHFATSLYADGTVTDSTLHGNLCIEAGFDPRFGHDDMAAFVSAIKELGADSVAGDVLLDVSIKDTLPLGQGWCWDDDETRLTPLLYNAREGFEPALRRALADAGIALGGTLRRGRVPSSARPIARRTHTIGQILRPMMKQSDNLCAEALFYQIGAHEGHAYAGRKQAARQVNRLIRHLGFDPDDYYVADGSGLSLYNYTTAELLVAMLRHAYTHEEIYHQLLPVLPVAGRDGTLRRRMQHGTAAGNVRAKTGTVEGVSSLAGYAITREGHTLCFAIINQGLRRGADGRHFQDRVCQLLTR